MGSLEILQTLERDGTIDKIFGNGWDPSHWKSLRVDHEKPVVERLWRQLEEGYRLYFHRIWPCDSPLFHPHPWPSAVLILSGYYLMNVGAGAASLAPRDAPDVVCQLELGAGSYYAMDREDGWHSVQPLGGPVLSIMITGLPWPKRNDHFGPKQPLRELTDAEAYHLFCDVRERYQEEAWSVER